MENLVQERKKVKSSRRSSILKKSPCRLPLEDLNVNNDSEDSRILGGKKMRRSFGRRVSFAEKPQIKEFNKHPNFHGQLQDFSDGREHGQLLGPENAENSKEFNIFNMLARNPEGQEASRSDALSELELPLIASGMRRASGRSSLNRGQKRKSFDINDFVEKDGGEDDDAISAKLSNQTEVYMDCDMSFTECVGDRARAGNGTRSNYTTNETKIFDDASMDLTCRTFFESEDRAVDKENVGYNTEAPLTQLPRASIGTSQSVPALSCKERLDDLKALANKSLCRSEEWYKSMLNKADLFMSGAGSPRPSAELVNAERRSAFTPISDRSRKQGSAPGRSGGLGDSVADSGEEDGAARQPKLQRGAERKHLFADTIIPFLRKQEKAKSLSREPSGVFSSTNEDRQDYEDAGRLRQANREYSFQDSIIPFLRDQNKSISRQDTRRAPNTGLLPVVEEKAAYRTAELGDQQADSAAVGFVVSQAGRATDQEAVDERDVLALEVGDARRDLTIRRETTLIGSETMKIGDSYGKEEIPVAGESEKSPEDSQVNSLEGEMETALEDEAGPTANSSMWNRDKSRMSNQTFVLTEAECVGFEGEDEVNKSTGEEEEEVAAEAGKEVEPEVNEEAEEEVEPEAVYREGPTLNSTSLFNVNESIRNSTLIHNGNGLEENDSGNWLLEEISDKELDVVEDKVQPAKVCDVTGKENPLPTLLSLENDPAYNERVDSLKRQKVEMEAKLAELNRASDKNEEDFIVLEEMKKDLQVEFKEIEGEEANLDQVELDLKKRQSVLEESKRKKERLNSDIDQLQQRCEELKSTRGSLEGKLVARKSEEAERNNDFLKLCSYMQRFLPWSLSSYSADQLVLRFFNFNLSINFESMGRTPVESITADAKITDICFEKNSEGPSSQWGDFVADRLLNQVNRDLLKQAYRSTKDINKLLDEISAMVYAHQRLHKDLFAVWATNNLTIENDTRVLTSKFISPPQVLCTEFSLKCKIDENSRIPKMQLAVDHIFGKDRTEMFKDVINDTKPGSMLFSRTVKRIKDVVTDAHKRYFADQIEQGFA